MDKIVTDIKILNQVSKETTPEEVKKLDLIKRLKIANDSSWTKGCGLAAIQIGIPLRFAWFIHNGREYTLLNPQIITSLGKRMTREGCLSIPNKWINIERAYEIEYISHGKKHRAKRFKANIVQHEVDHMDGILNSNRLFTQNQEKKGVKLCQ